MIAVARVEDFNMFLSDKRSVVRKGFVKHERFLLDTSALLNLQDDEA